MREVETGFEESIEMLVATDLGIERPKLRRLHEDWLSCRQDRDAGAQVNMLKVGLSVD